MTGLPVVPSLILLPVNVYSDHNGSLFFVQKATREIGVQTDWSSLAKSPPNEVGIQVGHPIVPACRSTQTSWQPPNPTLIKDPPLNPYTRQRAPVTRKERQLIKSVNHHLNEENALLSPSSRLKENEILRKTAIYAGQMSPRTVKRELAKDADDETPGKKRPKLNGRKSEIDDFEHGALKRQLYAMHSEGQKITVATFCDRANDSGLFTGKRTTMWRIMSGILKVKFEKPNPKDKFRNQPEKVELRYEFLNKYFRLKQKGFTFVWTDETWTNQNGTIHKVWTDGSPECSTRLKASPGKRIIIVHAGTSKGFLRGASLAFPSKIRFEDYHGDMNANYFIHWVIKHLIPNMPPNSVLVMDNAPYHSEKLERIPAKSWSISQLKEWLDEREISFDHIKSKQRRIFNKVSKSYEGKNEREALFDLALEHSPGEESYVVDTLLEKNGIGVLRLPPYHCDYNPIEIIWGLVKSKYNEMLAKKPEPWTLDKGMEAWNEALDSVTTESWENCVRHCDEEMKKDFKEFHPTFDFQSVDLESEESERFIIPLQDSSEDEDSSDEELARPLPWGSSPARRAALRERLLAKRIQECSNYVEENKKRKQSSKKSKSTDSQLV